MSILTKIVWRFNRVNSATIKDFNEKITRYQIDILKDKGCWNPKQVVVNNVNVGIKYSAWLRSPGEIVDNEILLEKRGFFENMSNKSSNGLFQASIFFKLNADNDRDFTALEMMYKINLQLASKYLGDRIYFEGLQEYETNNGFPCFLLHCGS
jgi:hypothetical protein